MKERREGKENERGVEDEWGEKQYTGRGEKEGKGQWEGGMNRRDEREEEGGEGRGETRVTGKGHCIPNSCCVLTVTSTRGSPGLLALNCVNEPRAG